MPLSEIRSMLDTPIISIIPEDAAVPKSIKHKRPVVHHRPSSQAALAFRKLASKVSGENFSEVYEKEKSLFEKLTSWFWS